MTTQKAILFAGLLALRPLAAPAASHDASGVLAVEHAWVEAAARGDAHALGGILAPDFVHTNYRGQMFSRSQVLATLARRSSMMETTSDHSVQISGDVAVVHGLNTVTAGGKVVIRLRYTDVYAKRNGMWFALCAQETPVLDPQRADHR